jgi:hypothetical protein
LIDSLNSSASNIVRNAEKGYGLQFNLKDDGGDSSELNDPKTRAVALLDDSALVSDRRIVQFSFLDGKVGFNN